MARAVVALALLAAMTRSDNATPAPIEPPQPSPSPEPPQPSPEPYPSPSPEPYPSPSPEPYPSPSPEPPYPSPSPDPPYPSPSPEYYPVPSPSPDYYGTPAPGYTPAPSPPTRRPAVVPTTWTTVTTTPAIVRTTAATRAPPSTATASNSMTSPPPPELPLSVPTLAILGVLVLLTCVFCCGVLVFLARRRKRKRRNAVASSEPSSTKGSGPNRRRSVNMGRRSQRLTRTSSLKKLPQQPALSPRQLQPPVIGPNMQFANASQYMRAPAYVTQASMYAPASTPSTPTASTYSSTALVQATQARRRQQEDAEAYVAGPVVAKGDDQYVAGPMEASMRAPAQVFGTAESSVLRRAAAGSDHNYGNLPDGKIDKSYYNASQLPLKEESDTYASLQLAPGSDVGIYAGCEEHLSSIESAPTPTQSSAQMQQRQQEDGKNEGEEVEGKAVDVLMYDSVPQDM